jgi:hypothetical protein
MIEGLPKALVEPIHIVHLGAAGGHYAYQSLLDDYPCQHTPLDAKNGAFVGTDHVRTFYWCEPEATSSFFRPNERYTKYFQNLDSVVHRQEEVHVRPLTDYVNMMDYLIMDIQGSELWAIEGADELIRRTLVIESEVIFVPLYENQVYFRDITQALSDRGFQFHRFKQAPYYQGRALKPMRFADQPYRPGGQQMWSDAIYLKPVADWGYFTPQQYLKLAVILHETYQSWDFAYHALLWYDRKTQSALAREYKEMMEGKI